MDTMLVTGMQRSGTTLLDKLLNAHPDISMLSQPFPLLFVEAKRAFLSDRLGEAPAYALGPLFLEDRYTTADLTEWLSAQPLTAATVRRVFADMADFSGQYTDVDPGILEAAIEALPRGDLYDVVRHLYAALSVDPGARVQGGKETICEEYLPYVLDRGGFGVLIHRDPRDVLASLNHGSGREHAGRLKPTLFNLRNWRKSVAFALHLEGRQGFTRVGYERLVEDPAAELSAVGRSIGVTGLGELDESGEIRDQTGRSWEGNSSHGALHGVSSSSVGSWQAALAPATARFVEAACFPELVALGYPTSLGWSDVPGVIEGFDDPYGLEREDLAAHLGPAALREELDRVEALGQPPSDHHRPLFLFQDVQVRLGAAVAGR